MVDRDGGSTETIGVIGRSEELRELAAALDRAQEQLSVALIVGEPGIGKTTVLAAGLEIAAARGFTCLESRPTRAEMPSPHTVLGDLLDPIANEVEPLLPEPQRRALESVLLRTSIPSPPIDHRTISVAFRNVLRILSERSPVLIAIDDAQWMDRSSAQVLRFTLRRSSDVPLAAFVSVRDGTADPVVDTVPSDVRTDVRLRAVRSPAGGTGCADLPGDPRQSFLCVATLYVAERRGARAGRSFASAR
jgi:Cdc6-like AAA superfamily ATPase